MSGPKKSSYQIRMERIRRERARKRAKQQNEIRDRLKNVEKIASEIDDKKISSWIKDIENSLNGDLRDVFRSLKRLEKYAQNQQIAYKDLATYEKAQQEKKLRELQEKSLKEERVKYLLESLENMKTDYKEVVNEAVAQRIEMFQKSLKLNPDNPNTLKQVEQFKNQVSQMYENYLDKRDSTNFVASAFQNVLGGEIKENGNNVTIEGNIDGVNIKVRLNKENNQIDFDTPYSSKCNGAMEKIVEKLSEQDIQLGAIKVLKTGQMLNSNTQKNSRVGLKA